MLAGRERALAEVDLDAIRHNVRRLMRDLPAGAVLCAVVKANGYGHGAVPVARAALEAGSTWLGVACVAEAEELRDAGLTAPVLIFGPMTGSELERAAAAGAEVVAWSARFLAKAVRLGVRVHIKFDSGMCRLGVGEDEARELCAMADRSGLLSGLMSHFATAEEADTTFFDFQLERFTALATELKTLYPTLIRHIANSAATLRGQRAHFDMVRVGGGIYGMFASSDDPFKDDLRPAMKLSSHIAGVRVVAPGDSVGYGRRFVADAATRIGIVPIGYGDGVCRRLANRGDVLVAGRRCRIAGAISMDQLTVRLPDDWGKPGDEVVFFGVAGDGVEGRLGEAWTGAAGPRRDAVDAPRILWDEVAQLLQTITAEVVLGVTPRVVRRYRADGPGV